MFSKTTRPTLKTTRLSNNSSYNVKFVACEGSEKSLLLESYGLF